MIQKINHIGIAVLSLESQIPFYRDVLQLTFLGEETVVEQKVKIAMFQCGEVKLELLEPTGPDSPVAAFLEKKGPGIHHIAFETDSVEGEIEALESAGIRLIDHQPRNGAHGTKIAFVHPASSGRILTELCEPGGTDK
ncbi:MAG: methylmalonyl-CoA epimerase [Acidobacteria bacterium]|nr:MAG: methylmalonyl-CoA epimerase [Acidobacteriota bacterium]RLE24530.1 MAG: methylmalonyl-CoA epimerase [Acidobacteriota bacterium]